MTWKSTTAGSVAGTSVLRILRAALLWCGRCLERQRQLYFLAQLDERSLRDIGLTREDVLRAINRPFWR